MKKNSLHQEQCNCIHSKDINYFHNKCLCKSRSPIEQYKLISKAEYIYLLETVNRQSIELAKEIR